MPTACPGSPISSAKTPQRSPHQTAVAGRYLPAKLTKSTVMLAWAESAFEKSGRVQSLSIGVNGAVEHQADHGQGDHRFGDLWQLFVILGEAPPSSEPAKCSFDHPPARQGNKAGGPCDRSHNDQGQAEQETGQEDSGAVVDTVSEHHLKPAVEWLDFAQKIPDAIGVLDVRGVDHKAQQQAGGVYGNVALAAFDLFRAIIAARPPFSVVLTLCVSMMTALGLGARPVCSRSMVTR